MAAFFVRFFRTDGRIKSPLYIYIKNRYMVKKIFSQKTEKNVSKRPF
jgi:hypothetical protein